ncbi:hypothetical protein J4E90_003012 [Alternaria incomplexa]|uniref:uncharacterized protein n=1 Tax=Alternaria ventricosa TaxID=1187951 RepID=UPI0020C4251B|nr:uncharacterized protein J4E93_008394 [Alternaria ventricosa]XP_051294007.1 uncharacterized protein J4E90_003012 [Alternaria incomplexa]KAI4640802.1 hypothetical protein J4E93_008394 [Alternaria ventricosa]KAI4918625.1 hypothetical protein J4E90_003012 [Alternaria incomplexa]
MELVPELVADSKLDTIFKRGFTIHHIRTPDTTPLLGKNKKKQKWEQSKELGRGSFGTVWLQKLVGGGDKDTDKRAVKQIEKRSAVDYSHELDAIAKFSQDKFNYSFVKSLGWYEDDKHVYISMEYLPHGDLSRHFDEFGQLLEHEAQCVAHQILDGLKSMHDHGFVHRDLKPQNVLIKERSPNWWVKLGDFGVSKRMQDAASLSTYTGTDGFMAPEVIMRKGHVNWKALAGRKSYTDAVDIWALGALVFQALTGSEPFAKDLGSYVEGKTPFPYHVLQAQSISRKGCDLLERLLQVIPENRPTASDALQDPWLKAQEATQRDSIESLR